MKKGLCMITAGGGSIALAWYLYQFIRNDSESLALACGVTMVGCLVVSRGSYLLLKGVKECMKQNKRS